MSRESWPVCGVLFARFSPDRGGPPFRSSRGQLEYTPHPQLTHYWAGGLVVVSPGGRELNVSVWVLVRGGQWFLCVRRDGLDDATAVPLVMELEPLDAAAPHWYSDPFDFFGEGIPARLFVAPML